MSEKTETTNSGSVDIPLRHPVVFDGTTYNKLSMRTEVYARDQIAVGHIKHNDALQEATLMANLCEVSPEVVSGLRMSDYKRLQSQYIAEMAEELTDPKP